MLKIGLSGKMRSGKDTLSNILTDEYMFTEFKFATGISKIIEDYFPDRLDKGKLREHYQKIGQSLRQLDPDIWVKYTDRMIADFENGSQDDDIPIVISDIRQMNEYKYAKANGYLVIKVEADEDVRIERIIKSGDMWHKQTLRHETETAVDDIPADIVITNNGTLDEFEQAIKKVMMVILYCEVIGISVEDYINEYGNVFLRSRNIRLEYL